MEIRFLKFILTFNTTDKFYSHSLLAEFLKVRKERQTQTFVSLNSET
jgi:hypothetical protein